MLYVEMVVVRDDGSQFKIPYGEISRLEAYSELEKLTHHGVPYAGPLRHFVKLTTKSGDVLMIPRGPQNDTELLSFMLRQPLT